MVSPKYTVSTTDVMGKEWMASQKVTNQDPIHRTSDDGINIKNSISMLEVYNLIRGTTAHKYRHPMMLYPHQMEFVWKVTSAVLNRQNKEVLNLVTRQGGKTTSIGALGYVLSVIPTITSFFYKEGLRINIFAPKREQSRRDMREIEYFIDCGFAQDMLGMSLEVNSKDEKLFNNGVYIKTGTASDNAKPEGDTCEVLILEECQDISDLRILKSLFPMTAHTFGTRVLSGTPTPERRGYFYNRIRTLGTNHPDVVYAPYSRVIEYSPAYKQYIETELSKKRIVKDSVEFRSQFALEWVDFESRFIDEIALFSQRRKKEMIDGLDSTVVMGLDVAKKMDTSVLTVVAPDNTGLFDVVYWDEPRGKYPDQARKVIEILKKFPCTMALAIDTFGAGDGFTDILEEFMKEDGLDSSIIHHKPMNPENKSRIYKNLKSMFDAKQMFYPEADNIFRYRFEEQMLELCVEWNGNKMNPSGAGTMHDDYPDSLALAAYATAFISVDPSTMYSSSITQYRKPIYAKQAEARKIGDGGLSDVLGIRKT